MSDSPYVDLNGVLTIEKNYLGNLNASDPGSAAIINNVQSNLDTMYKDYIDSHISTDAGITYQKKMMDIVNSEKERLHQKKQSVDAAIFGQKRAVELGNSNRLRQSSYTNLLLILIVTLVLFVAIMIASTYLTFIPQVVYDILSIIVISVGIYVGLYSFLDIQSRNNMNFNELNLPGLNNSVAGNSVATGNGSMFNLITGSTGCVGSDCCDNITTKWDNEKLYCKAIPTTSGFTTMSFAYKNGDLSSINNKIESDSPYEFENYVPAN